jgi:hypothetical protein
MPVADVRFWVEGALEPTRQGRTLRRVRLRYSAAAGLLDADEVYRDLVG